MQEDQVVFKRSGFANLVWIHLVGLMLITDLQAAGRPGLNVVVDAGSADTLVTYAKDPSSLVHGLVGSVADETNLRNALLAAGRTDRVTVSIWDGKHIPFVENTVNQIVCDKVTTEVRRVLAPYGCAVTAGGETLWTKPYPKEMDEWPQYLCQPNGNRVSQDMIVGPPRRIQWVGAPRTLRHHDHLTSLSAMVSAKGRLYYIFDEQTPASIMFPPKWALIARDAFNGVVLWKKEIPEWLPHLWPLKSMPATLPRRLASMGDDVYVTLGIQAPVSHLKGADGNVVKTYAGSDRCEEIVVHGNTLLVLRLIDKGPLDDMDANRGRKGVFFKVTNFTLSKKLMGSVMSPLWLNAQRRLIAYDLDSGKQRWQSEGAFAPLSLATDGKRVYAHNGECLIALDMMTGDNLWTSETVPVSKEFHSYYGVSLVVHDDVVLFSGGENYRWTRGGMDTANDTMTAVSAVTGKKLWTADHPTSGYRSPEDLFVAQGLVWAPNSKSKTSRVSGLDPKTGEVKRTLNMNLDNSFHHRCYSGRATEQYMLLSKVGINTVPFDGKCRVVNDQWVRGACGYGYMPANGLIYAPPDPCNCFAEAKLNGFAGLAPADTKLDAYRQESWKAIRVEKGESFVGTLPIDIGDWPTYRADAGRTGTTRNAAPTSFRPAWKAALGGKLSAPVVDGGLVFVSLIDKNQVVALDSSRGNNVWTYVTGSRVDSPPTVVGPLLYFGAADGYVTCLKSKTGAMVWRRRVAPTDEKIVDEGRLESVWPVHGSVTYHNKLIYAIAGRNMYVDGGLHFCALDPLTGEAKYSRIHTRKPGNTGYLDAPPSKPDILSASGDHIFMRSLAFNLEGKETNTEKRHIYSVNGYLNDSWFHRAFWTYGSHWRGGHGGFSAMGRMNHSGRIMINDGTSIYSFGRTSYGWGSSFSYILYRALVAADVGKMEAVSANTSPKTSDKKGGNKTARAWSVDVPVLARSIVKTGDRLIITGPTKLYDENSAIHTLEDPSMAATVKAQAESWNKTADLLVISAADGKTEQKVSFDFAPVWDGVAVAEEALFLSATDGALYRLQ